MVDVVLTTWGVFWIGLFCFLTIVGVVDAITKIWRQPEMIAEQKTEQKFWDEDEE